MAQDTERDWRVITDAAPPSGDVVEVLTPGGDERPLKRSGRMWFLPDGSMYVYFTPTAWRPLLTKVYR